MVKIGITDLGEPCFDTSWIDKTSSVDGLVLVSKGHSELFHNKLLELKDKAVWHCTVTGLGGTKIESGVVDPMRSLDEVKKVIDAGFHASNVVVRIDPIIGNALYSQLLLPTSYYDLIESVIDKAYSFGVRHFRYSYLDLYAHARKRFEDNGFTVPKYPLTFEEMEKWATLFKRKENELEEIKFMSCAEKFVPEHHKVGCVSIEDFKLLGLDPSSCSNGLLGQRKTCLCCSNKVELLKMTTPCKHGCLYCFIKDK